MFHKCERIFINRTREHTSLSLSVTGTLGLVGRMGPQRPVPPAWLDHLHHRCPGCPRGAQGGGTQTHGKDSSQTGFWTLRMTGICGVLSF